MAMNIAVNILVCAFLFQGALVSGLRLPMAPPPGKKHAHTVKKRPPGKVRSTVTTTTTVKRLDAWTGFFSPFLHERVSPFDPGKKTLPLVFFYVNKKPGLSHDFDSNWESHFRYNFGTKILDSKKQILGLKNSEPSEVMRANGLPLLREFAKYAKYKKYDGTIIITTHSGSEVESSRAGRMSAGDETEVNAYIEAEDIAKYYLKPALEGKTKLKRVIFLTCSSGIREREKKSNGELFAPWDEKHLKPGTSLIDKVLGYVRRYVRSEKLNREHVPAIYGANGYVYTPLSFGTISFTVHTKYHSNGAEECAKEATRTLRSGDTRDASKCDMTLMPLFTLSYQNVKSVVLDSEKTEFPCCQSTTRDYLQYSGGSGWYEYINIGPRSEWTDYEKRRAFVQAVKGFEPPPEREATPASSADDDALPMERENGV